MAIPQLRFSDIDTDTERKRELLDFCSRCEYVEGGGFVFLRMAELLSIKEALGRT
jgi:hypothetical protein